MTPRTTSARRSHAASPTRSRSASPAIPRRVSGPVARPARLEAGLRAVPAAAIPVAAPRARGPLARVLALPDHRLLDRLLRGRMWIWMIGIALGGIVAMQVSLLKLNTGISRAVHTSATLEHQNAALETSITRMSSQDRIQKTASALGMAAPEAGDIVHVRVRGPQDGRRAANRMTEPSDPARAMVAAGASGSDPATAGQVTATGASPTAPAPQATAAVPGAPLAETATTAPAPAPAPAVTTTTAPAAAPVAATPPVVATAPQG